MDIAFQNLSGRHARRAFFDQILPTLSAQEWRDLQLAVCDRKFQFDIVGNVPVEIFCAIFRHLGVVDIFKFQNSVCKRWSILLNDATLLKTILPAEFLRANAALYKEATLSDASVLQRRFGRLRAFQACKPVWKRRHRIRTPLRGECEWNARTLAFCSGTTAAIVLTGSEASETVIECRNLYSGKLQEFRSVGRERIARLALTTQICGWTTFTRYVICARMKCEGVRIR